MVETRSMPLLPTTGKGKELMDLLRRELNIPAGVRWFEVRFAMSEAVTVRLEYQPRVANEEGAP